ncbi:MAG: LLM class flavin-dependent oxidoreductase [Armatimonadota bacterium]|nr:LLM class flavin-dependent oxidoreductase [Armatimonadota bacterium]MDR7549438.1 LLM class flavin-dependent oxidoreductase [Armatimonadota bacterium]
MGQNRPLGVVLRDLPPPVGPRDLLPARTLVEFAVLAEDLGYDSVWVPEGRGREAIALIGAMAPATARIRLATGILPFYSRPPALVAMAATTLADLSGGRFILGIGAGHAAIIEGGYGLDYRDPLRAARECIVILRQALAGGQVRVRGRIFRAETFQLESRPRHAVPIYLAALGPRMLHLAGEVADGVVLNWATPEQVQWAAEAVREAAQMAGRDPDDVTVVAFVRVAVTEARAAAWQVLRRLFAVYAAMPAYAHMFGAAGLSGEIMAVTASLQTGGVDAAAAAVSGEVVETLGLVGSAEACREGLNRYRRAGADLVVAYPFPVGPDAKRSMRSTIEGLGPAT